MKIKIQSLGYHVKWILETNFNIYFWRIIYLNSLNSSLRAFHLTLSANSTCKAQKDIYINYTSNIKKFEGKKNRFLLSEVLKYQWETHLYSPLIRPMIIKIDNVTVSSIATILVPNHCVFTCMKSMWIQQLVDCKTERNFEHYVLALSVALWF